MHYQGEEMCGFLIFVLRTSLSFAILQVPNSPRITGQVIFYCAHFAEPLVFPQYFAGEIPTQLYLG